MKVKNNISFIDKNSNVIASFDDIYGNIILPRVGEKVTLTSGDYNIISIKHNYNIIPFDDEMFIRIIVTIDKV